MSFPKLNVSIFLWWMSFIHRTCSGWMLLAYVLREWGIHCCFFVVVVLLFGCLGKSLLSVQLVSCACIPWICCVLCSCSSYFVSFCLFGVFLMGSALCLWNALRHLGIVFPWLLCPDVASSTSCLGCSFLRVDFGAAFLREPSRGIVWVWPTERGQSIFLGFSHNRDAWVKTGAVPQGEGFCKLFFASETCI